MNVVFLDIDGVLRTGRTCIAYEPPEQTYDPVAVKMIASICKQSDMRICITSSSRVIRPIRADFLIDFVFNGGKPLVKHLFMGDEWKTGVSHDKNIEISEWLKSHPETKVKLIIDSTSLCDELSPYLVHVVPFEGYTFENYLQSIKIIEDQSLTYGKVDVNSVTPTNTIKQLK